VAIPFFSSLRAKCNEAENHEVLSAAKSKNIDIFRFASSDSYRIEMTNQGGVEDLYWVVIPNLIGDRNAISFKIPACAGMTIDYMICQSERSRRPCIQNGKLFEEKILKQVQDDD